MSDKHPPLPEWVEALMPKVQPEPAQGEHANSGSDSSGTPALTPVTSSNIHSVGHDGNALYVKFHNGTMYRYPTAGADLHAGIMAAESAGQYFHKHIKLAHQGEKVT